MVTKPLGREAGEQDVPDGGHRALATIGGLRRTPDEADDDTGRSRVRDWCGALDNTVFVTDGDQKEGELREERALRRRS